MFYTMISKDSFDQIMTLFFRNLGLVTPDADLEVKSLEFDGDVVIIQADLEEQTLQ